jgi:hypothetical protein
VKYLCLVHLENGAFGALSREQRAEIDRRSLAYDEQLKSSGHLIHAEALQSPKATVLVRVRNGEISAADGPFTETREQLCGFILIEARDRDEAIRLAAGIPLAELGAIEVRPVYEVPTPP